MGTAIKESKLTKIDGVQVYTRKDNAGKAGGARRHRSGRIEDRGHRHKLARRGYGVSAGARSGPARSTSCSRRPGRRRPSAHVPLAGL